MSVLKQKLDKAAEQFQIHHFKESLASYEDCLAFCYRTRQAQSLIFNIMTTKAALLSILGQHDKAMITLNDVLNQEPSHYLGLIRRSQVYKKKGKFNRALKDLEMVSTFCPDNLQVTAMRIEIETLKSKNKNSNSSEQSDSEEELDEDQQLNFSNLKTIDRKSCSIVVNTTRKSRVTISGDTAFQYEQEDPNYEKSNNSTSVGKESNKDKYQRTFKQIEMENDTPAPAKNIVSKPNPRSKSILKNKQTNSIINTNPTLEAKEQKAVYGGRESRMVEKIKDIDGKMISSSHILEVGSEKGTKQVQFRKSLFTSQEKMFPIVQTIEKKEHKQGGRKSCLKGNSFDKLEAEIKEHPPARRSKFQMLSRNSIDGIVIKNRKSIDPVKEIENDLIQKLSADESDQGSSYNIFGSNENVVISKQIKEKLGLNREEPKGGKGPSKQRSNGGKSILKKNSVLVVMESSQQRIAKSAEVREEEKSAKKPKKSVMFTKSKFAD